MAGEPSAPIWSQNIAVIDDVTVYPITAYEVDE